MTDQPSQEPVVTLQWEEDRKITLLGTAHVSRASADKVRELLSSGDYDAVAVELCPSRYNALIDPDALSRMDLFQVIRSGKVPMVAASLALGAYQQRMAEQFGVEPGAEMRAAVQVAGQAHLPVLLIDREVGVTLRRIYRNVPWWRRSGLIAGLFASLVSSDKITEEDIEKLKEGDVLESTFSQFAEQRQDLYRPLIQERDRYMAARLRQELEKTPHKHLLAVVGAGHLKGIADFLKEEQTPPDRVVAELDTLPPPGKLLKKLPWVVVALVLTGFAIGFSRSPELGLSLILDWIMINGGLSALGALLAAAHPLTVIGAFMAAPLTSLNPTVGAGMVTAGIELWLRKPTVGDFARLRRDTTEIRGWWRNRVARTFLIFLFSTLGSAAGTYIAGFRIFDRLTGG